MSMHPVGNTGVNGDRYQYGFQYRILPFNTTLQMKGNDPEVKRKEKMTDDVFFVGDFVKGFSPKDKQIHTGVVCNLTFTDDGVDTKYVWIIDSVTKDVVRLRYGSVKYVRADHNIGSSENYRQFDKNRIRHNVYESLESSVNDEGDITLSSGVVIQL